MYFPFPIFSSLSMRKLDKRGLYNNNNKSTP